MGFEMWGYQFEGAYRSPDSLESRPGIYVVWCEDGGEWTVLYVGESANVKERVANHERADCWRRNCSGSGAIYYSATYTPNLRQATRIEIEREIRRKINPPPPCGERESTV